jgi:hypothetical protein
MEPEVLGVQFEVEGVERAVDGISQFSGAVSGLVGSLTFLGDSLADVTKAGNYFYQSFFAIGPQLESMFLMVRGSFQMLGATAEQAGMLASKALKQAIAFAEYTPYQQWVVLQLQQALARGGLNVFKEFGTLEEVYMETLKRATGEEKRRIQSALDSLYDWQKQTKVTYLSILADLVAAHGYAGYQLEWVMYHLSRVLETGGTRGLRYLEWWLPQLRQVFKRGEVPKSAEEFVMKVFEHLKKTGQLGASAIASGTIQGLMEGFREMKTSLLQRVIGLPEEGGLFDRFRRVMNKFYDEFRKRLFTAEGELTGVGKAFGDALKEAFTTAINVFERVGVPLVTRTMDFLGRAIERVTILRTTIQGLALLGVGWQVVGKPAVGFLSQFEPIIRYLVYFKILGIGIKGIKELVSKFGAFLGEFGSVISAVIVLLQALPPMIEDIRKLSMGMEKYVMEPIEKLPPFPSQREITGAWVEYRRRWEEDVVKELFMETFSGEGLFGELGSALLYNLNRMFGILEWTPFMKELRKTAKEMVDTQDKFKEVWDGMTEESKKYEVEFERLAEKHPQAAGKIFEAYQNFKNTVALIEKQVAEGVLTEEDAADERVDAFEDFIDNLRKLGKEGEKLADILEKNYKQFSQVLPVAELWKRELLSAGIVSGAVFPALEKGSLKLANSLNKLTDSADEVVRRKYEEARAIREALIAQYLLTEINLRSREQLFNMLEVLRRGEETLQVIPPRGSEGNQTYYNKEVNINVSLPSVSVSEIKNSVVRTAIEQARGISEELVRYV